MENLEAQLYIVAEKTTENRLPSIDEIHQQFHIKLEGGEFHSSFPAPFAEALTEIQKNFYKLAAYALYGQDDIRRLTKQDLKNYELVFTIQAGSTEIWAEMASKIKELCDKVMEGMDGNSKAVLMLILLATITVGGLSYAVIKEQGEVKRAELTYQTELAKQQTEQIKHQEETKRLQEAFRASRGALPTPKEVLDYAEKTMEDNRMAVVRGAKNAEAVTVGGKHYNQEQITEINQRAERGQYNAQIDEGIYTVVISNFRQSDIWRLTLADSEGNELSAALNTEEIDVDTQELIWQAMKNRTPLKLTINKTFIGDTLKDAYIKQADSI